MSTANIENCVTTQKEVFAYSYDMKDRFKLLIKRSKKSLEEISIRSGYSVDYIHRLKRNSAKERFNEHTILAFSKALDIYPSELLPLEWQKPTYNQVDINILAESIKKIYEAAEDRNKAESMLPPEKLYELMAITYNEKIQQNNKVNGEVEVLHE